MSNNIVNEYLKCMNDIPYYASRYCTVYDQTQKGFVPAKVFPRQKDLLNHLIDNRYSIVLKPRQAGVSTITALYCAHKILFSPKSSPTKVLIVANKRDTAIEFLKKIKGYIDTAPTWLGSSTSYTYNNKAEFEMGNKSGAKAVGTSPDALRGYTPNILVLDEAAFIEGADELWTASAASLSTGGRAIFISTPNGQDPLYYKTYDESIKGKNDFKIFDMYWWQDPRFNKDLIFEKKLILDYEDEAGVKKREVATETKTASKLPTNNWDFDEVRSLIAQGYEPTSEWFRGMCASYNWDERKIAQELKTVFTGSGDNVVKDEYIIKQETYCTLPIRTGFFDNNLDIFEEPIDGHQYILGSDVSRGDADDFSSIEIWNMTTGEQAAEWVGKVPPDVLGQMIDEIGRTYNAYAVVDITGGLGSSTIIELKRLNYPLIHLSEKANATDILTQKMSTVSTEDKIPGFLFGKNRTNVIACVEHAIRNNEIKIKSKRLINEFKTFVYINGRPDHLRGFHDDLIMALAMILYTYQYSFKEVQKYQDQTKKMLDAMVMVSNSRPTFQEQQRLNDNNDYSWLF